MRFFKRGETADSKFTFLDSENNEPMDVNSAVYRITHYDGPNEVIDVPDTALDKITGRIGEYVCAWVIPGTAPENETYFVTASGIHPVDGTTTNIEDFYRVLPASFFSGGGGGGSGLVAKFTKP